MSKSILVVDDLPANIEILLALLGDEYDLLAAIDGESALEIAEEDQPDLILLDIIMPNMNGYSVAQELKRNEKTKDIPIIFITAVTDEMSIEKAYEVGGIDYVTKPFKPKELRARVNRELQIQALISNLAQSKEELQLMASTDAMSGLYNRRYFSDISEEILSLAQRNKTPLSVLMIDIDYFKNINDTYGHKTGDEVIVAFASVLKESARKSDVICRWGGEEFVLLLPQTDIEGARAIGEKIRETIANLELLLHSHVIKVTVSIGAAQVNYAVSNAMEHAINQADEVLYHAKRSGRNKVMFVVENGIKGEVHW